MIDIDTDRLQTLMNMLSNAVSQIDEAASLLMQVTTHNDWGCPERYRINEYISQNRSDMQRIQSDSHAFASAARSVTNEFIDEESGIGDMFSTLEGLLARTLAESSGGGVNSRFAATGIPGLLGGNLTNIFQIDLSTFEL